MKELERYLEKNLDCCYKKYIKKQEDCNMEMFHVILKERTDHFEIVFEGNDNEFKKFLGHKKNDYSWKEIKDKIGFKESEDIRKERLFDLGNSFYCCKTTVNVSIPVRSGNLIVSINDFVGLYNMLLDKYV